MSNSARLSVVLLAVSLGACSKIIPKLDEVIPDNRQDYVKAQTLPDLEVPPDLSTEAIRDRMAIPEGGDSARYSMKISLGNCRKSKGSSLACIFPRKNMIFKH